MGVGERASGEIDVTVPSHARVYDYILGGKDNFAADRKAAARILTVAPDTRQLARANRGFLVRVVRTMAQAGIDQFIDLGTGIPTSPNVHEVAQQVNPAARVVYVDNDAIVLSHNRALLATDAGVATVQADIRDPDAVLTHPDLRRLVDFDRPVGVLMVAVLHLVADEEDPAGIVARFAAAVHAGSHLAIAQFAADSEPEATAQALAVYENSPTPLTFRSRDQIQGFFRGLELLEPGVVDVHAWRSVTETDRTALRIAGGVGRKP